MFRDGQDTRGCCLHVQDCIPTSLLKLSADNSTRAVKMFAGVQKYMAEGGEAPAGAAKAELVQKLLHQVCLCRVQRLLQEHLRLQKDVL